MLPIFDAALCPPRTRHAPEADAAMRAWLERAKWGHGQPDDRSPGSLMASETRRDHRLCGEARREDRCLMAQARDLGRFLQQPTPRERAVRGLPAGADLPFRIGPAEFSTPGRHGGGALPARPGPVDARGRRPVGAREAGAG
jgi:hypothetical protein